MVHWMKQRVIRGLSTGTQRRRVQLLVRDVPDDLVEALKKRAAKHGRSAEAEHRLILEEVLRPDTTDFWEEAAKLRDEIRGRKWTDSTDLIRQDRDER